MKKIVAVIMLVLASSNTFANNYSNHSKQLIGLAFSGNQAHNECLGLKRTLEALAHQFVQIEASCNEVKVLNTNKYDEVKSNQIVHLQALVHLGYRDMKIKGLDQYDEQLGSLIVSEVQYDSHQTCGEDASLISKLSGNTGGVFSLKADCERDEYAEVSILKATFARKHN